LHLAALYNLPEIDSALVGSKEVASILLKKPGINLNPNALIPGGHGHVSALHCCESPEIAKMLLDHDSRVADLVNMSGLTVMGYWLRQRASTGLYSDAAYERGLLARLDLLLKCDALKTLDLCISEFKSDSALRKAACVHGLAIFQRLWNDERLDHEEIDDAGDTLLHAAASHGNVKVVRFLLDQGADLTLQNQIGQTALTMAEELGQENVVDVLRERTQLRS
jgi:hypothetical protein